MDILNHGMGLQLEKSRVWEFYKTNDRISSANKWQGRNWRGTVIDQKRLWRSINQMHKWNLGPDLQQINCKKSINDTSGEVEHLLDIK